MGFIIDSSRSGTCFSSCLTSSKHFSKRKKYAFYRVKVFLCSCTHRFHSLKSVSGPCSIEKVYPLEWRIAIPAPLMRVDDCMMSYKHRSSIVLRRDQKPGFCLFRWKTEIYRVAIHEIDSQTVGEIQFIIIIFDWRVALSQVVSLGCLPPAGFLAACGCKS